VTTGTTAHGRGSKTRCYRAATAVPFGSGAVEVRSQRRWSPPGIRCVPSRYPAESLSRVTPGCHQDLPFYNTLIEVELKDSDCCLSFGREGLDDRSPKDKMILPTVAPRVEEADEHASLGIERADIAPLPGIASKASVREVVNLR